MSATSTATANRHMPPVIKTKGLDLLLTVGPRGIQVYTTRSRGLTSLMLRTIADSLMPTMATPTEHTLTQLWAVVGELAEALELARHEPGPLRTSTDDVHTAVLHLRAVIETM